MCLCTFDIGAYTKYTDTVEGDNGLCTNIVLAQIAVTHSPQLEQALCFHPNSTPFGSFVILPVFSLSLLFSHFLYNFSHSHCRFLSVSSLCFIRAHNLFIHQSSGCAISRVTKKQQQLHNGDGGGDGNPVQCQSAHRLSLHQHQCINCCKRHGMRWQT